MLLAGPGPFAQAQPLSIASNMLCGSVHTVLASCYSAWSGPAPCRLEPTVSLRQARTCLLQDSASSSCGPYSTTYFHCRPAAMVALILTFGRPM